MQITSLPRWLMIASAATDRNHRIDRFQTSLQRLFHRLTVDHARGNALNRIVIFSHDRPAIVHRISQRIDDPAHQCLAHRHLHDAAGALHQIAFFYLLKVAEQYRSDFVLFEVEREAAHIVRKLKQFAGHHFFEAVNLGNAVADLDHSADFHDGHAGFEILDLLANDFVNFVCFDRFHN
jgi:hypothetical protein